jgi:hypothetical protein
MNRSQSDIHSGFSTHRNGNPALAVRRATAVSNNACSPLDHPASYPGKDAWCTARNDLERRGCLDSRDDCVASENAGLGARVDGTEPPIEGEYIGWEQELTDNNDDDSN